MDWVLNATVVAAVLVFVYNVMKFVDSRSAIARLERLVKVRLDLRDLPEVGEQIAAIDKAIGSLTVAMERKEANKSPETALVNSSAALLLVGMLTMAAVSELMRFGVEIPYWGWILVLVGLVASAVGMLLICGYVLAKISLFVGRIWRKFFSKDARSARKVASRVGHNLGGEPVDVEMPLADG